MESTNGWTDINSNQVMYTMTDNSEMNGFLDRVNICDVYFPIEGSKINLGIKLMNNKPFTSNYVGICRLRKADGSSVKDVDGKNVILKVEPRFNVSVVEMLNEIKKDDEFERYLAPQTVRIDSADISIEELEKNELFYFFDNEEAIHVTDNIAHDSSVITATVYISMLKNLCRRPLMGKMVEHEENLTGKAKGKILFSKNIRTNMLRGREDRIYCRYLTYSEDIVENQILKIALNKASQYLSKFFTDANASSSYGEMISYCNHSLSHVSDTKLTSREISKIRTTGCYSYYKPVIAAAKMVLDEITVEANGKTKTTSYVVPYAISMNKLFEMYCRSLLKKAGIKSYVNSNDGIFLEKYDYKKEVFEKNTSDTNSYIQGVVKPDIIIRNPGNEKTMVFDVKYKNLNHHQFAREDRLQLLAYGWMFDCLDIGILFPANIDNSESESIYYEKNQINKDGEDYFYHQWEIFIDKDSKCVLKSKKDGNEIEIYDYIKDCLSQK